MLFMLPPAYSGTWNPGNIDGRKTKCLSASLGNRLDFAWEEREPAVWRFRSRGRHAAIAVPRRRCPPVPEGLRATHRAAGEKAERGIEEGSSGPAVAVHVRGRIEPGRPGQRSQECPWRPGGPTDVHQDRSEIRVCLLRRRDGASINRSDEGGAQLLAGPGKGSCAARQ